MSILIKDAKMPKNCHECGFKRWTHSALRGSWFCPLRHRFLSARVITQEERYSDCPLVEIPPHGRLIDASEMAIKFSCLDLDITAIKNFHELLMEIPTVIERDE